MLIYFLQDFYDEIADQIFKLREQREKCTVNTAARDAQIARINELQDFHQTAPARLKAFGEALVKRWIERIIVWEDHFTVELKSGLNMDTAEEDMNEYEFKVVWALSELANVKWWHRNISRLGFQINGPVHAYPDIIVMLHSGKILMVETKGDHLDNDESKEKAKIGDQWAKLAGKQYKYYMVFETKQPDYPGAYSLERFMEIVKGL